MYFNSKLDQINTIAGIALTVLLSFLSLLTISLLLPFHSGLSLRETQPLSSVSVSSSLSAAWPLELNETLPLSSSAVSLVLLPV